MKKEIVVAVIGNPNSGKSTLINSICGSSLQVGNWPGVTVEKKEALMKYHDHSVRFVDLPGVYSLSPFTAEEEISRNFLINNKPDIILNVIDSTNLERNLYLTLQLLDLDIPLIIALNMTDEAKKKGYTFDIESLEKLLKVDVVCTVATKKIGIDDLLNKIINNKQKTLSFGELLEFYDENLLNYISKLDELLNTFYSNSFNKYPKKFLINKILEQDSKIINELELNKNEAFLSFIENLKKNYGEDISSIIPDKRYEIASKITQNVLKKPLRPKKSFSEKLDYLFLHNVLSIPIFLFFMWAVFKISFDFSSPYVDLIDEIINLYLVKWTNIILHKLNASDWFISLITDGVIAGVGSVMVFLPVIASVMFILTFLEGSGYMARAAFVMDKLMNTIGLHGKSFIPLIISFGCNVPGIYATRTLETERDRKLTALLTQFMSCGARLPVYILFAGIFFEKNSGSVIWILYVIGIIVSICVGIILQKTIFKSEKSLFIMELPPYRVPTFRDMFLFTWNKVRHFLIKAGTYLVGASIIIWFLLNMPWGVDSKKDSYLGIAGQFISPILAPLGFGSWEAGASLISGIIAKEAVVSTMVQIYTSNRNNNSLNEELNLSQDIKTIVTKFKDAFITSIKNTIGNIGFTSFSLETDGESEKEDFIENIKQHYDYKSAFSFMIFVLVYFPCIVTLVAAKLEFKNWSFVGLMLLSGLLSGWLISFLTYRISILIT